MKRLELFCIVVLANWNLWFFKGYTDGGIVVEDCLLLMLNLLQNNTSNINFFKEGSYIQKLAPMFVLPENLEEVFF